MGATPEEMQRVYDREASYQRPRYPIDQDVVDSLADRDNFNSYLGQQPHYSNYLLFFQREIEAKGVRETLEEHVFADNEHAKRMFALVYNGWWYEVHPHDEWLWPVYKPGIFHPYLHLGFAFEYNQPALVAESLAMASVHAPDYEKMEPVYIESETLAGGPRQPGQKTLRQLMQEMRENKILRTSIDGNNLIDRSKNVADNAMQKLIEYAAQYSISDDQLEDRMYEMIATCCNELFYPWTSFFDAVLIMLTSSTHCYKAISNQERRVIQDRLLPFTFRQHSSADAYSGQPQVDFPRQRSPSHRMGRSVSYAQPCVTDCASHHGGRDR